MQLRVDAPCWRWPAMPVRIDNRFGLAPMAFGPGSLGFQRDAGMGEVVQLFIEDDLTMQKGVSWISPTPPRPPEAPPRWTSPVSRARRPPRQLPPAQQTRQERTGHRQS